MAIKISKNRLDMGSTPIKNVQYLDVDQVATPAAPATGKTRLYGKSDGSLYVVPAAGSETAVSSSIPANLVAYFNGAVASIPSGWTEFTAARGRVIVGVPLSGTVGGTVGSALTNLENQTHAHTYTTVIAHTHSIPTSTNVSGTVNRVPYGNDVVNTTYTASTGDASGTTATATALPPYIQQPAIVKS